LRLASRPHARAWRSAGYMLFPEAIPDFAFDAALRSFPGARRA
jgi:hypothetical protein